MTDGVIIGIDIGTTSVKAVAYSPDTRRAIASETVPYPTTRPRPGWVEQDPDEWTGAVGKAWMRLSARLDGREPVGIGVCSQVNTHVLVNEALRPLTPAIVWKDLRCVDAARELDDRVGGDEQKQELWGGPFTIDASFALSRLRWWQLNRPELVQQARYLLLPKDYVIAAMCGVAVTDPISSIGLVDSDGRYLPRVLDLVDGASHLVAPLADFDETAGRTSGALGFPPGVTVAVGTMDAWGNVYGSGVVRPGQAMEIAGTSEIIGVLSDTAVPTEGVVTFPPVRNRILHAGPTQAGGDALAWFSRLMATTIGEVLEDAASAQGRRPVLFLPHLDGERAPVWNPDALGVFLGLRSDTESADMARAVLEGVAFSGRLLLEACETAAGIPVDELRLSGGAARSPLWNQIKASVHGRPISVMRERDSGALGAALMAGISAGLATDLESWAEDFVEVERVVEPDPTERDRYEHLYGMYRETYSSLVDVFARFDPPES